MAADPLSPNVRDPDFDAMWDAQLLSYPTITRSNAGVWNYFDVTPVDTCWQFVQGLRLGYETLTIASQNREADEVAVFDILCRVCEILSDDQHPLHIVLSSAHRGGE